MHTDAFTISWIRTEQIRDFLYRCFFFFMPFTQALTFKVGFPLKFSELALVILGALFVTFDKKVNIPSSVARLISFLFLVITCSVLINIFWTYAYPLKEYPTRFGYNGDSIARYIYFILAILAFLISIEIFRKDLHRYTRYWIYGAITAAAYTWYLSVFSALHLPYYLLPGMENPPQMINGSIVRCGTFPEGNSMGLFLLVSGALALYIRMRWAAVFLFASIIPTFSTLGIVSLILFMAIYLKTYILQRPVILVTGIFLLLPVLYFGSQTKLYKVYIHDKLFTKGTNITNEGSFSKVDRLISFNTALKMGMDNPVWGVGLSNYGRHYEKYLYEQSYNSATLNTFQRAGAKTIPNNMYVEVFAESGMLALGAFVLILLQIFLYVIARPNSILTGMLICMFLCFNAYPSFIMIYIWAALAFPVAHYLNHQKQPSSQ